MDKVRSSRDRQHGLGIYLILEVENASSFDVLDDRLFTLGMFVPHVRRVIGAIRFWGYLVGLREGVGWVVWSVD